MKKFLRMLVDKFCKPDIDYDCPSPVELLRHDLEATTRELEEQEAVNAGLNSSIGMMEARNSQNIANATLAIASLVSMMGGSVIVSKDIVIAIQNTDLVIDYKQVEEGTLMTLVVKEENGRDCVNENCNKPAIENKTENQD